ncbi:MAG: hypothetical protein OEY56_07410 [Cyclobacteriaceae bacterium]|nr:hypothetical protein [Cyclobacteriaceae bacterium]
MARWCICWEEGLYRRTGKNPGLAGISFISKLKVNHEKGLPLQFPGGMAVFRHVFGQIICYKIVDFPFGSKTNHVATYASPVPAWSQTT